MPKPGRGAWARAPVTFAVVTLLVLLGTAAGARASGYPALPLADDRGFLGNLSAPPLVPGASGSISFAVGNPLSVPITSAVLTLQVYAFNAFPGNATSTVPVSGAPLLSSNSSGAASSVTIPLGTLATSEQFRGSVAVATASSTPSGTFAVRTALSFVANSTDYLLESRGWFTAALWAAATELPNGSATLNLSVLGVSGVLPETGLVVEASSWAGLLFGVLVTAAAFVGIGAWIYFRRGSPSRSGTRRAEEDHQAPSAFGKRRTRDGD